MASNRVFLGLAILLVTGGIFLLTRLFADSSIVLEHQLQEFVYVDTNTGEAFLLRARSSPEYHPMTGDPTLIPGLYCENCKAWKAVGPLEMLQTSHVPPVCPIHKRPLTQEGPLPDSPE